MSERVDWPMFWTLLGASNIITRDDIEKALGEGTTQTVEQKRKKPSLVFRDLIDELEEALSQPDVQPVTMLDMDAICEDVATKVSGLFSTKNQQYAKTDDVLKAFRDGAGRRYGEVNKKTMLACLCAYKDKHDLALLQHGAELQDAEERFLDIIIYSLLGIAILRTQA